MLIQLSQATIRPWRIQDISDLARHADDRAIWRNLRQVFPHPYTERDARQWVGARLADPAPLQMAAIAVGAQPVGAIGVTPGADVFAHSWELGYWLAREYWGRGIMTEAACAFTRYAFETFPCTRIYAGVFGWNGASARVLEKAGYTLEGRHRHGVFKDGEYTDHLIYGILREELQE